MGTPVPLCLTLARALVVLQSPRLAVKSRQCFTWVTKAQKAVDGVQRGYLATLVCVNNRGISRHERFRRPAHVISERR